MALDYRNYGIFLIMESAGFIPSTVVEASLIPKQEPQNPETPKIRKPLYAKREPQTPDLNPKPHLEVHG